MAATVVAEPGSASADSTLARSGSRIAAAVFGSSRTATSLMGVMVDIDTLTGKAVHIERVQVVDHELVVEDDDE